MHNSRPNIDIDVRQPRVLQVSNDDGSRGYSNPTPLNRTMKPYDLRRKSQRHYPEPHHEAPRRRFHGEPAERGNYVTSYLALELEPHVNGMLTFASTS